MHKSLPHFDQQLIARMHIIHALRERLMAVPRGQDIHVEVHRETPDDDDGYYLWQAPLCNSLAIIPSKWCGTRNGHTSFSFKYFKWNGHRVRTIEIPDHELTELTKQVELVIDWVTVAPEESV